MPALSRPDATEHVAAFHVSDAFIIREAAAFVAGGIRAGERVIVLSTQDHWNAMTRDIEQNGIAVGRAAAEGRLVLIEAEQLVETLTVGGRVNLDAFRATLQPLIGPGTTVRIYGEVVSLLVGRNDLEGALAIEHLGQELAQALKVKILCGYHVAGTRPLTRWDTDRIQGLHDRSVFEESPALPGRTGQQVPAAAE